MHEIKITAAGKSSAWVESEADEPPSVVVDKRAHLEPVSLPTGRFYRPEIVLSGDHVMLFGKDVVTVERM